MESSNVLTTIQIVFIILKLINVIDWSWWYVLTPIWITIILAAISGVLIGIFNALKLEYVLTNLKLNKNKEEKKNAKK